MERQAVGPGRAASAVAVLLVAVDPGLHCASGPAQTVPARSGFYALQYPQSSTAPAPRDVCSQVAGRRSPVAGRRVPALIVKGRCDYLSWTSAVEYRRLLPRSQLVYLPAAGHNTYQDQPAQVLVNRRAFLTGEPLPGAGVFGADAAARLPDPLSQAQPSTSSESCSSTPRA